MKNTTDKMILVPLISDGPNSGFKAVPNPDYVAPSSYTLTDLRELAREYADERHCEAKLAVQLALSCFCEWIQRREAKREQGKGRTDGA